MQRWKDDVIRMSPEAKRWVGIWKRTGRRVKCTDCLEKQRTKPHDHVSGLRLREMACTTEGCLGRLRTMGWWDALSSEAKRAIGGRALRARGIGIRARRDKPGREPPLVH